jgi:hypothetical protein
LLRHGLSEDPSRPLHGFLEADETFIGGRGDPTSPGRSTTNPDKSLVVAAVEKLGRRCRRKGAGAEESRIAGRSNAPSRSLRLAAYKFRRARPSRGGSSV